MRKVLFKKWVPRKTEIVSGNTFKTTVKGTGCYEPEFINEGLFHQWGVEYEEFDNRAGNCTIALIEISDGTIEKVLPSNLKFIS